MFFILEGRNELTKGETMDSLDLDAAVGAPTVPNKLEKTVSTHPTSHIPLRLVLGKSVPFHPGSKMFWPQMLRCMDQNRP